MPMTPLLKVFHIWRFLLAAFVIIIYYAADEPIPIPGLVSTMFAAVFMLIFGLGPLLIARPLAIEERAARYPTTFAVAAAVLAMFAARQWVFDWKADEWVLPVVLTAAAVVAVYGAVSFPHRFGTSPRRESISLEYAQDFSWEMLFPLAMFVGAALRMLEYTDLAALAIIALMVVQYFTAPWRRKVTVAARE